MIKENFTLFSYSWSEKFDDDSTIIRIYGLSENNENVCVIVKDFLPYVYLELPNNIEWTSVNVSFLTDAIDNLMKSKKPHTKSLELLKRLYYANMDVKNLKIMRYPYLLLRFHSVNDIKELLYITRKPLYVEGLKEPIRVKVHENNATPVLQLTCARDIPTSGWINISGIRVVNNSEKITTCKHEFISSWLDLNKSDSKKVARPLIMSYDIEAYSSNSSKMPDAHNQEDRVFQLSCVFHRFGDPITNVKKVLITLGDPIQEEVGEDVEIIRCGINDTGERILLDSYADIINKYDPNIIVGFNIFNFDIPFMYRKYQLRYATNFLTHTMLKNEQAKIVETKWSSSAFKNQDFKIFDAEGRIYLDLLPYIQRNYKFDNYRLKTIAEALVGSTKDPLTPKGIFKCYELGTKSSTEGDINPSISLKGRKVMSMCGKYCVQDSYLVLELMDKIHAWVDLTELSKICNVSILSLYTKGQQIRVFSQIYKKCYKKYVVERDAYIPKEDEHYQGAIVFDPIPGMYDNVIPFDFSSLYPTSIIAENIDFSTLVIDDTVPNKFCNTIEWDEHYGCEHDKTKRKAKTKYVLCSHQKYRFLKNPKGILPSLLEDLISARKQTKKEIEELEEKYKNITTEKEKKELELYLAVLDKRQLAFKVCANSGYGAMGVKKGYLPFMPGAKCTTAVGRRSIEIVAKYIPEHFGGKLIYGDTDSNYIHFPHFDDKPASEIWDYAINVAEQTSKLFKAPMKLEFESKIYKRFLILTKKRYMCLSCKKDGIVSNKIDKKGVLLARRDNSKAIRDIYSTIIMKLFHKEQKDDILYTLIDKINKLCSGTLFYKEFVVTKSVGDVAKIDDKNFLISNIETKFVGPTTSRKEKKKGKIGDYTVEVLSDDNLLRQKQLEHKNVSNDYEYYLKSLPAQAQLAEKMRRRGQLVSAGSRLEYLIITDGSVYNIDKEKQAEKLEDMIYYNNHNNILQIDYLYYLKALSNPMDEVISIIYKNESGIKDDSLLKKYKITFDASSLKDFVFLQYKIRLHRVKVLNELKSLFRPKILFID